MCNCFKKRVKLEINRGVSFLARPFNNRKGDDGNEQGMVRKAIGLIGLTLVIVLVATLLVFGSDKANTMVEKVKQQFQTIENLLPRS